MNETESSSDAPITYAIRIKERAKRDVDAAIVYMAQAASKTIATEWNEGLRAKIAALATMPRRYPAAPERFRMEIRRALYRRSANSAAYWIYFAIEGEEADSPDGPTVVIRHVRHAASKPLTRTEIRRIEAAE